MLKLRKIAITGGLSCGKSSVCRILKEQGAYVVSADKIVHHLLSSDTNFGQEVVKLLGPEILVEGKIDRSKVADIVFNDLELLYALEHLIHPAVEKEIDIEYQKQQNLLKPPPLFVAEIPMLYEAKGEKNYDKVVCVIADLKVCRKRFTETTGYEKTEFDHRMARQISLSDKALLADYVIHNNGTISDLQTETIKLYQKLIKH